MLLEFKFRSILCIFLKLYLFLIFRDNNYKLRLIIVKYHKFIYFKFVNGPRPRVHISAAKYSELTLTPKRKYLFFKFSSNVSNKLFQLSIIMIIIK